MKKYMKKLLYNTPASINKRHCKLTRNEYKRVKNNSNCDFVYFYKTIFTNLLIIMPVRLTKRFSTEVLQL